MTADDTTPTPQPIPGEVPLDDDQPGQPDPTPEPETEPHEGWATGEDPAEQTDPEAVEE